MRVLVAGVGHPNLRDLSFGQVFLRYLAEQHLSDRADLENLSFGAIAVLQWFQDVPGKYGKVIFLAAAERSRPPGSFEVYDWNFPELDEETVQERVNEAVTGIISLDNLLTILTHFRVLPPNVSIVEIEPVDTEIGFECSAQIEARFAEFAGIVEDLIG